MIYLYTADPTQEKRARITQIIIRPPHPVTFIARSYQVPGICKTGYRSALKGLDHGAGADDLSEVFGEAYAGVGCFGRVFFRLRGRWRAIRVLGGPCRRLVKWEVLACGEFW